MVKLLDLTTEEVKRYLEKRKDVILPLGSLEEHGPHLPLSTDGDIALALAEALGERLGIAVAPVVWYGVCVSTAPYPGTVGVSFDGLRGYVRDILEDLYRNGFEVVYLLSGHLGSSQKAALKEAYRDIEGGTAHLLDLSEIDIVDIVETAPMHACEAETSLMLYLYPEKVEMEKAVDEEVSFKRFSLEGSLEPTKSGVFGHPTKASTGKGERIFKRLVGEFSGFIASRA